MFEPRDDQLQPLPNTTGKEPMQTSGWLSSLELTT